ncbi:precorrin-2 C20-methyltransferase [Desulfofarcimen acetoxidans DSM 771]|uniref:Precorrin-2 C20-methyltransferase n=1 Tax=Desulfofarcimen acetoxidans (strain ATCC 49208 / DSM 771 / KCTC 5769 / VKM B-1644 / 5575) TaxID=485916 RepID=C8W686_DESAS|nr:precorrin-2 C(20)-methyltransferase [Desulfofarcimen acetoxidans]ACV62175.1 precorrin-2 C20-methyltransferase [Desulfofarcimen acetoxidans DSM 771]
MPGKFFGIGVGPGDPELLTFKAYKALEQTEILCIPKSSGDKESLALSVVSKMLSREFNYLELHFPMSMDAKVLKESWDKAGQAVAECLLQGRSVSFVTIGDPMFYSTYGYLLRYLKNNHPDVETQTIPGITAFSACASYLQIPLVEAEETVAVIPAAYGLDKFRDVLDSFDNIVLMKVNRRFDDVLAELEKLGLKDKAVFISRVGYPEQYATRDLDSLAGKKLDYMSLIIVQKRRD